MIVLAGASALFLSIVAPRARGEADLATLFTKAGSDPAAVLPLILAASERLAPTAPGARAPDPKEAQKLADTLEPFCRRAFFGPERFPGMEKLGLVLHTVRSGEVPERIAKRYKIGAGMLAYLNAGFEPKKLREGETLKVLDLAGGALDVVVEKSLYRLSAWRRLEGGGRVLVEYASVG